MTDFNIENTEVDDTEEYTQWWCSDCEIQVILPCSDLCEYCQWKKDIKTERYCIYNSYWTKHFESIGRLIPDCDKTKNNNLLVKPYNRFLQTETHEQLQQSLEKTKVAEIPKVKILNNWADLVKNS